MVNPETTQLTPLCAVQVKLPGVDVAVYEEIAAPPSDVGAVQLTEIWPLPTWVDTEVGAPGAVGAFGVTAVEAVDGELVPTEFVAVTTKVYAVPFVSPVTVQLSDPVVVQVFDPGVEVTV